MICSIWMDFHVPPDSKDSSPQGDTEEDPALQSNFLHCKQWTVILTHFLCYLSCKYVEVFVITAPMVQMRQLLFIPYLCLIFMSSTPFWYTPLKIWYSQPGYIPIHPFPLFMHVWGWHTAKVDRWLVHSRQQKMMFQFCYQNPIIPFMHCATVVTKCLC